MSRCKACNVVLDDFERTRKEQGRFIDLCRKCLSISNEAILDGQHNIEEYVSYVEFIKMLNDQGL